MKKYILHRYGNSGNGLAVSIPAAFIREMELMAGDLVLFKREPDGLRLRIVRHSTTIELANAQDAENQPTQNSAIEDEAPVAAE